MPILTPTRLLVQWREHIRCLHYNLRTEEAYVCLHLPTSTEKKPHPASWTEAST